MQVGRQRGTESIRTLADFTRENLREKTYIPSIHFSLPHGGIRPGSPPLLAQAQGDKQAFMTVEAPAEERAQALQQDLSAGAATSWQVDLNLDLLSQIAGPDGARADIRAQTPLAGNHLDLDIPGRDQPLRLLLDTVYEGFGGVINYAGIIDGDDGSLVAISIDSREVLGKIHHSEGFTYLIESHHDQEGHILSVIDQTLIPRTKHKHGEKRADVDDERDALRLPPELDTEIVLPASTSGNVRLLMLYTPAVAAQTNIQLMANNIVSGFNQSLLLSEVDSSNYVTLADVRMIDSDLTTPGSRCNDEIVEDLMGGRTGPFTLLDDWMEVAYADIALSIVTTERSYSECIDGLPHFGRIGGQGLFIDQYPDHNEPFSVTTHTFALADLTAIHEIGHVLNGAHAHPGHCWFQGVPTEPYYACGHAPEHCEWQTMMGGYFQCNTFDPDLDPGQQVTVRIARWSNPDVYYDNEPTGVPNRSSTGGVDAQKRHMAKALNTNMPVAAAWKGTQATPPSAPDPVSASPFYCWGMNSVSWTTQSGTAEYRLFSSSSSNFTNPTLMYSGPDTSTTVNVGQTSYMQVKACNSGGCSPYSSQVVAHYYNGCM